MRVSVGPASQKYLAMREHTYLYPMSCDRQANVEDGERRSIFTTLGGNLMFAGMVSILRVSLHSYIISTS